MGYENSYSLSFRYETFGFEAKYGQFLQVKLLVYILKQLVFKQVKLSVFPQFAEVAKTN